MSKGYDFIGDRIKRLRVLKGRTQIELGNAIGLPKQSVSLIEKGQRRVSSEELEKICHFFGIPVEFLLKDGWIEKFEKDNKYEPKNQWGIEIPPYIDDIIFGLEDHLDYLVNSRLSNVRMIIKDIENTIKVFKLFLKKYKENNK